MIGERAVISNLAVRYLSRQEEEVVHEYMLDNQTSRARLCLLAKVDLLWEDEKIKREEALSVYHTLGIPPKECYSH